MSGTLPSDRLFNNVETKAALQPTIIRTRYFEVDADETLDISSNDSDNKTSGSIIEFLASAGAGVTITVTNPVIGSYLKVVNNNANSLTVQSDDGNSGFYSDSIATGNTGTIIWVDDGSNVPIPKPVALP